MTYRRSAPKNPHDVRHYRSWFTWRECEVCNLEFRREKGFAYELLYMGYYHTKYMCAACGCHSEDFVYVNQYIDYMNHGRKPKTHPLHSPPPMRP